MVKVPRSGTLRSIVHLSQEEREPVQRLHITCGKPGPGTEPGNIAVREANGVAISLLKQPDCLSISFPSQMYTASDKLVRFSTGVLFKVAN